MGEELRHPDPLFAGLAAVAALGFVVLTIVVALHPGPVALDRPLEDAVQRLDFGPLGFWNTVVSWFGGLVGVIAGAVVVIAAFLRARAAAPFIAVSALYSGWYNGVMLLVRRPRPTGTAHTVHGVGGFSYPSGHEGFFLWVGVLFLLLVARRLPRPLDVLSALVVGALVVMAGVSRVYVGAHWPTDVVGGFLVTVAWICFALSLRGLSAPVFTRGAAGNRAPVG
jgi:membrane-associated phospholipid phosphatase